MIRKIRRKFLKGFLFLGLLASASLNPVCAQADDFWVLFGNLQFPKEKVRVVGGPLLFSDPNYEGADENEFKFLPYFDLSLGETFFFNLQNGLGLNFFNGDVTAGISMGYYRSREEEDSRFLKGLGNIDGGIDGRLFGKIMFGDSFLNMNFRTDLSGNHDGSLFTVGLGKQLISSNEANWTLNLNGTWATENYVNTYFDVTVTQSISSGFRHLPFDGDGGLKDIGLTTLYNGSFSKHMHMIFYFNFTRLLGDVADSPLVEGVGSAAQIRIGTGLVYRF